MTEECGVECVPDKEKMLEQESLEQVRKFCIGLELEDILTRKNTCLGGRGCGGIEVEFFNDEVLLFGQEDQTLFYFLHPSLDILQADTAAALAVLARSGH